MALRIEHGKGFGVTHVYRDGQQLATVRMRRGGESLDLFPAGVQDLGAPNYETEQALVQQFVIGVLGMLEEQPDRLVVHYRSLFRGREVLEMHPGEEV